MIWRSSVWCLCLGLALVGQVWAETVAAPAANTLAAVTLASPAPSELGSRGMEVAGGKAAAPGQGTGNSATAQAKPMYDENYWMQDFEVHFLVSLPFTALYSYVVTSAVDATVQGRFPTTFRPADMWVVLGLALGSSMAVALGSINRVPDQSVPRLAQEPAPDFSAEAEPPLKLALIQIDY